MTENAISSEPRPTRIGAKAREQLLEAAGEIFATKGLHEATSREICELAGMNVAAVNYHFGRFEALYTATLVEAHRRAVKIDDFQSDTQKNTPPRETLRAFLTARMRRILLPISRSWEVRLLSRAVISPSDEAHREFFKVAILPEHRFVKSILGEILGRPADDPVVSHAFFCIVTPGIFLAIANRSIAGEIFMPDVANDANAPETLIAHYLKFAFAGLDALAANTKAHAN